MLRSLRSRSLRTVAIGSVAGALVAALSLVLAPTASSLAPTPSVSSFTPTAAMVGTAITITGTNLAGATSVVFNFDVPAPVSANTDTEVTTVVPLGDDDGPITVTTPGGTATSSTVFVLTGFYVGTQSLPSAPRGRLYSTQIEALGGKGPYHFRHAGHLPKGLTLSPSGLLSGTPSLTKTTPGTYPFVVTVHDSTKRHHLRATSTLSITVT